MDDFIIEITQVYKNNANKERAQKQKTYMRNQFNYFGLLTPTRRKIDHVIIKKYQFFHENELIEVTKKLWNQPYRDYKYCAVELLIKNKSLWSTQLFYEIYELIKVEPWWDTIDDVSRNIIGVLLQKYPELITEMHHWIDDENFWIRRVAIIFQLRYKKETNTKLLFDFCLKIVHEKEFFIRKAIGWALREYSKTDSCAVKEFLTMYQHRLSPLSIKEAKKYLT